MPKGKTGSGKVKVEKKVDNNYPKKAGFYWARSIEGKFDRIAQVTGSGNFLHAVMWNPEKGIVHVLKDEAMPNFIFSDEIIPPKGV